MQNSVSLLWDPLHEAAGHIDPNTDIYAQITKALDAGVEDDALERVEG